MKLAEKSIRNRWAILLLGAATAFGYEILARRGKARS